MFFNPINMYGKPVYQAWGELLKINRKNVRKEDKKKRNISEVVEEKKIQNIRTQPQNYKDLRMFQLMFID